MDYMDGFNGHKEENAEVNSAGESSGNREELNKKLRQTFDGKIVRKDLTKHIKEGANVPIYVLEYLLGQYCNSDDEAIIERGVETVKSILANNYVRPDEAQKVLSILRKKGSHTVIDLITVELNMKLDMYEASFSNLGLTRIPISEDYPEQYDSVSVEDDIVHINGVLDWWTKDHYDFYGHWLSDTVDALKASGQIEE